MESIHRKVRKGDAAAVRRMLASADRPKALANELDERGHTPLYDAVETSPPSAEVVEVLLQAGADPGFVKITTTPDTSSFLEGFDDETKAQLEELSPWRPGDGPIEYREPLVRAALTAGNLEIVQLLHAYGADFTYEDEQHYTAVLDGVHGERENLEVVRYLIGLGLDVDVVSSYGESPVSVASHLGRFGILTELLKAGANETPLQWTPLHRAAAVGTVMDVRAEIERDGDIDAFERWGRTALHLALISGDWAKVEALRQGGAEIERRSDDGAPSLSFAVEGGDFEIVRRVLALNSSSEDKDAALIVAVERNQLASARLLLAAGANPNPKKDYGPLIAEATRREMILALHEFGADLTDLSTEGRRTLLGLVDDEEALDGVSREAYLAAAYQEEGTANPQNIGDPFRKAMIRSGWSAYGARRHFDDPATFVCELDGNRPPAVWCFDRFGQSTTILPDGRTVLIAGEHEDYYDPDFRIYNDVAVFEPNGAITVLGYPYAIFPPTDFHSATLVGSWIYIVGSLGYAGTRDGAIPVVRLSVEDFHIEPVATTGEAPRRIFRHKAVLTETGSLRIEGGTVISFQGAEESHDPNEGVYELDLRTLAWSRM